MMDYPPEYNLSWVDKIRFCPYCGKEMQLGVDQVDPDVATFECECGFSGVASPPRELDPLKGVIREVRL